MSSPNTYIDLFAGCGGLSLGLHLSGWKGIFAIEKNKDAFSTLEHNLIHKNRHFDWPNWLPQSNHDINDVLKLYSSELKELRNKIELVVGGPPCQGFSTAGKRYEEDERNKLIDSYLKFIRTVQPKLIFFENVKGFTQKFDRNKVKGRVYSRYVTEALERKNKECPGYKVEGQLVNFADYGVPQKRTRFILVGIRKDIAESVDPEHFFEELRNNRESFLISKGISLTTSLEEAISDLLYAHGLVKSPDTKGFMAGVYGYPLSGYQKYLRNQNNTLTPDSHRFPNHRESTIQRFEHILGSQ
jgi:DNA (cytosine-5)-methyltransferase 1